MKKIALIALAASLMAGCSSNYNAGDRQAELMKAKYEMETEQRQQKLDEIPDWFLEPDQFDENGFYAVAVGESTNMNLAIREAKLRAQAELAGQVSQLISAQEKLYTKGDTLNTGSNISSVIESFIMEQDVAGTVFDRKDMMLVGDKYLFYTRAYLPVKMLKEAQAKAKFAEDLNLASEDAQRELMMRVQKAKDQKAKELEAEAALTKAKAEERAARIVEQAVQ